ncbi:MAG: TolC family protein [Chthonomonas sp.]|nr:TolC family protein [Chthonomonas sp.]
MLARPRLARHLLALTLVVSGAHAAFAFADVPVGTLTLSDALKLAKERNGRLGAAIADLDGARAQKAIAQGAFLPTLTPNYDYSTGRRNTYTGSPRISANEQISTTSLVASWQLLDSGARQARLRGSRNSLLAQELTATDTLRQVLFSVHQSFFDALRAQELLRVQEAQRTRATAILEQTKLRVEVGDAPRKDILQATADQLNSEVSVLQADNQVTDSLATLRAVVGLGEQKEPMSLERVVEPKLARLTEPLTDVTQRGMSRRADIAAQRKQVEATRFDVKLAEIDGGIQYSLDTTATRIFGKDVSDRKLISFTATVPLFDGARSKETVRSRRASLRSQELRLLQSEREAAAEIESAYKAYNQNAARLEAANAALAAAQENFDAANEAMRLGAGSLIDILTAQVSLVTAESNRVQALYDALISDVRYRLAVGEPLPGEE